MTLLCRLMKCPGWQRHIGVCRISRIGIHSRLWLNNNENQKTQVCLTVCHRSTFSRLVFVKLIIIINSCQFFFSCFFLFYESNIKHFGTEWIKLDNKVTPNTLLCKLTWTERSPIILRLFISLSVNPPLHISHYYLKLLGQI